MDRHQRHQVATVHQMVEARKVAKMDTVPDVLHLVLAALHKGALLKEALHKAVSVDQEALDSVIIVDLAQAVAMAIHRADQTRQQRWVNSTHQTAAINTNFKQLQYSLISIAFH